MCCAVRDCFGGENRNRQPLIEIKGVCHEAETERRSRQNFCTEVYGLVRIAMGMRVPNNTNHMELRIIVENKLGGV